MITRALERYLRIAPRKLGIVADLIRQKKVSDALYILMSTNKKGAAILKTVVESALSNAKRIPEKSFDEEELFVSKVAVDMGPTLKRFRAMSLGRAGVIRKRTSHVLVELDAPQKALSGKTAKSRAKKIGRK